MIDEDNDIRTAEWARKGHPDRLCDILSDSILDEFLKHDSNARVAINVFGCDGVVNIGGEVTTKGYVEIPEVVKRVYREIGYEENIGVLVNITAQSPQIKVQADVGAGDSGIMIGYATRETEEMLPLEVVLARKVADYLDDEDSDLIQPDGKVQVTLENGKVKTLVVAYQGHSDFTKLLQNGIEKLLADYITQETQFIFIPFWIGGFIADTGMTGRKNVLWYGPRVPTGGGAFAGKDPTKVDRSGAYFARWLAIEELKRNSNLTECLVEIAFIIGRNEPIMFKINHKTMEPRGITVSSILKKFDLRKPIYKNTSLKGHFGDISFPWEK